MVFQKDRGFTLVEIVIVILVIGILAAIAAPKFVNMTTAAKIASEDGVAGALASAINIQTSANMINGIKNPGGYYYPRENPFTFLAQAPPNKVYEGPGDGKNWQWFDTGSYGLQYPAWYIYCPHYDGPWNTAGGTKGRFYIYQWGNINVWGHKAGDLWIYLDNGH